MLIALIRLNWCNCNYWGCGCRVACIGSRIVKLLVILMESVMGLKLGGDMVLYV